MNLEHVEFYNLGALEPIPGLGDNGLVRVPAAIRNQLNNRARLIGMDSVGVEIRFVTEAPNIDLYLSAQQPEFGGKGKVRIYKGNYLYRTLELEPGVTTFHRLTPPPAFAPANEKMLNPGGFAHNVWRIVCDRTVYVVHGIHAHGYDIRPPHPTELPRLNWLAYGSSITNASLDGYVHIAAAKLRVQVQNKGFSGSCHIEPALVDYLLDECSFDFITCELGINMRGQYSPEEFEQRASYLIGRLTELRKPALIIPLFPNNHSAQYAANPASVLTEREEAYTRILERLVREANCPTLRFVSGSDILDDVAGLSADLLHPTTYGHAVMGFNLAAHLKSFLLERGLEL
ncbi:MAG: lysophospholipase [Paenibacillus sp.]|jgi:lysophospholipase L1-like esterase|nr:lysophospholipase [Paenibacillus sp.]